MVEETKSNQQQGFNFDTHEFKVPAKNLETVGHVALFKESQGNVQLTQFIQALMKACKGTRMSQTPITEVSSGSGVPTWFNDILSFRIEIAANL